MRRLSIAVAVSLVGILTFAVPALAQKPAQAPGMSAADVIERSIQALGGRAAQEKHTSLVLKGTLDIPNQGLSGTMEIVSKAPNKQVTVMVIPGAFSATQGFDGTVGWSSDSMQGTRELSGVEAAVMRRSSVFAADLRWKELWQGVELATARPVNGKETVAVKMIPKTGEGNPVTVYYDKATYLPLMSEAIQESAQGRVPVTTIFSDFREVGGVKMPYVIEQQIAIATIKITFSTVQYDVPVDDTRFAKPK